MPRWIALLRAVNVGGRTVRMADLRGWFGELGFGSVATFIASGNLVFDARGPAPALERRIEAHLLARLGFEVGTFVRTPAELRLAAGFEPAGMRQGKTSLYVGFTRSEPGQAALGALQGLATPTDRLHVRGREVYWVCQGSQGRSTLSSTRLERALGMPLTLRNITTVRRLAAQWGDGA